MSGRRESENTTLKARLAALQKELTQLSSE